MGKYEQMDEEKEEDENKVGDTEEVKAKTVEKVTSEKWKLQGKNR